MSTTLPFLFELGVEEIPHWMIEPALADLDRLFQQFLSQNGFQAGAIAVSAIDNRAVRVEQNGLPEPVLPDVGHQGGKLRAGHFREDRRHGMSLESLHLRPPSESAETLPRNPSGALCTGRPPHAGSKP